MFVDTHRHFGPDYEPDPWPIDYEGLARDLAARGVEPLGEVRLTVNGRPANITYPASQGICQECGRRLAVAMIELDAVYHEPCQHCHPGASFDGERDGDGPGDWMDAPMGCIDCGAGTIEHCDDCMGPVCDGCGRRPHHYGHLCRQCEADWQAIRRPADSDSIPF